MIFLLAQIILNKYQACCKKASLKEASLSFVTLARLAHAFITTYNESSESCFCQSLSYSNKHKICSQRKSLHQKLILNITKSAMTSHLVFLTASFPEVTQDPQQKNPSKYYAKPKQNKISLMSHLMFFQKCQ